MLNSRLIIAIFPGLLGFDLQSKKIGKLRSTLVPFLATRTHFKYFARNTFDRSLHGFKINIQEHSRLLNMLNLCSRVIVVPFPQYGQNSWMLGTRRMKHLLRNGIATVYSNKAEGQIIFNNRTASSCMQNSTCDTYALEV